MDGTEHLHQLYTVVINIHNAVRVSSFVEILYRTGKDHQAWCHEVSHDNTYTRGKLGGKQGYGGKGMTGEERKRERSVTNWSQSTVWSKGQLGMGLLSQGHPRRRLSWTHSAQSCNVFQPAQIAIQALVVSWAVWISFEFNF